MNSFYLFAIAVLFAVMVIIVMSLKKDRRQIRDLEEEFELLEQEKRMQNSKVTKVENKPQLYYLQTDMIRYKLYSIEYFKNHALQSIYEKVVIEKYNFEEPFYSSFFAMLLIIERNDIFTIDPKTKFIYSNIRDESNKIVRVRSYHVLSIADILHDTLVSLFQYNFKDPKQDIQDFLLAVSLSIFQKADNIEQSYLHKILLHFVEQKRLDEIQKIADLIAENDEDFAWLTQIIQRVINSVPKYPYGDNGEHKRKELQAIEMPQKQLIFLE